MSDEAEKLRREVASMRDRIDELADTVSHLGCDDLAPDGSGIHPVVLPRVQDVPVGQDTRLLHMAVKPFLRRRLGGSDSAAQVLIEVVQRDASGRESSWLNLPPPLLPSLGESQGADTARLFEALGDAGNRRLLRLLWDGEKPAWELGQQGGLSENALRLRLTTLQELGWLDVAARDRYLLTARGRRALVCAWALSKALTMPR